MQGGIRPDTKEGMLLLPVPLWVWALLRETPFAIIWYVFQPQDPAIPQRTILFKIIAS